MALRIEKLDLTGRGHFWGYTQLKHRGMLKVGGKKTYNELTQLTPKTSNLPPVYPQSLFNEKSESFKELKGYSDKELAEELKKRGFKVMVQEITYKEI